MPDWEVLNEVFGDDAGPVQVLLVFSETISDDDIQSLQHVAPFSFHPAKIQGDDFEDFFETFCHILGRTSGIPAHADSLLLANFKNERDVRSEGAAFLLKLVSNSNLISAYKMSDADMEEVLEYDRRWTDLCSLLVASEEMQSALKDYIIRKANHPKNYIRNYDEIIKANGFFSYELDGDPFEFDIDSSKIISVEGRCDHLSKMLATILSEERSENVSESAAFLERIKII